jgi:hypothetical protein
MYRFFFSVILCTSAFSMLPELRSFSEVTRPITYLSEKVIPPSFLEKTIHECEVLDAMNILMNDFKSEVLTMLTSMPNKQFDTMMDIFLNKMENLLNDAFGTSSQFFKRKAVDFSLLTLPASITEADYTYLLPKEKESRIDSNINFQYFPDFSLETNDPLFE